MVDCHDCAVHSHTGYRDHESAEPCPTCMGSGELPRTCKRAATLPRDTSPPAPRDPTRTRLAARR